MEIEEKANYCLNCKLKPCASKGCPLQNDIPEFIKQVKDNNYKEAYKVLSKTTVLPGICGQVCPHTRQCQGSCIRGIKGEAVNIGDIEYTIFQKAVENGYKLKDVIGIEKDKGLQNKKVAIVGGGPAGLTCAAFLAKKGIKVTIYEKYNYLGGLLMHGIPEFRLPRTIVKETINRIIDLGISVKYNKELGNNLELEELEKEYDAVFLCMGANKSAKLGINGENLEGVYGGNELLEYNKHPDYENKIVCVIGGGNVAMDCSRTIKKMGAKEVNIIYRREEEQMPAEEKEINEAKKEGIKLLLKNNIVQIKGNKKVNKIELIKTDLVKIENETRAVPMNIEGSNYELETDYVVAAIGGILSKEALELGLEIDKAGKIKINEKNQTSNPKIFAGGDLTREKGTISWAAYSGRKAAQNIEQYLKK